MDSLFSRSTSNSYFFFIKIIKTKIRTGNLILEIQLFIKKKNFVLKAPNKLEWNFRKISKEKNKRVLRKFSHNRWSSRHDLYWEPVLLNEFLVHFSKKVLKINFLRKSVMLMSLYNLLIERNKRLWFLFKFLIPRKFFYFF